MSSLRVVVHSSVARVRLAKLPVRTVMYNVLRVRLSIATALKTYEGNNQVHYVHSSHNVLHIVPYEAGYVAPMIYTYEHRI